MRRGVPSMLAHFRQEVEPEQCRHSGRRTGRTPRRQCAGTAAIHPSSSVRSVSTRRSDGKPDAADLWGRCLRHAALATLILAAAPLTVGEVLAGIEARGRRITARYPRRALADALAYECQRGRVVRQCRGTYRACRLPKTTRWRILTR